MAQVWGRRPCEDQSPKLYNGDIEGADRSLGETKTRAFAVNLGRRLVIRRLSKAALALVFVFSTCAAHADGDEFFASTLRTVGSEAKNGFMGNVKDEDGRLLQDAVLTVLVKVPADGGSVDVTYKSFTNVLGRYRTLDAADVVAVIQGTDVELKPGDVKLVGVAKDGYAQVRRLDRSRAGQTVREVDFVMKKVGN